MTERKKREIIKIQSLDASLSMGGERKIRFPKI